MCLNVLALDPETVPGPQVEAREKEVALWRERGAQQQALLQTAAAREATLQEHLDGLRAQVGETGAALQHHMGSYAQYQEVIDRSNQVRPLGAPACVVANHAEARCTGHPCTGCEVECGMGGKEQSMEALP